MYLIGFYGLNGGVMREAGGFPLFLSSSHSRIDDMDVWLAALGNDDLLMLNGVMERFHAMLEDFLM